MVVTEDITMKKRKVIYDEFTGGFYAETKVESLKRQCEYRSRLTDVINKAEHAKYRYACKQVDSEKQLFLMRKEKAVHRHSEALQDHKAHMNVLGKLAKEREKSVDREVGDNYGKYPPNSIRPEIEELINNELKEMSPIVQRRREATKLLLQRNSMGAIDKTMSTEDLFGELKNRKSRASSPTKTPVKDRRKAMPKLILPTITVKMSSAGDRPRIVHASVPHKHTKQPDVVPKTNSNEDMLPSVFITDTKGSFHVR